MLYLRTANEVIITGIHLPSVDVVSKYLPAQTITRFFLIGALKLNEAFGCS